MKGGTILREYGNDCAAYDIFVYPKAQKQGHSTFITFLSNPPFAGITITTLYNLFLVLGTQGADGLTGAPDLKVADLLHLLLVLLTVVLLGVVVEGALGLGTVTDGVVELVEEGLQVVLEAAGPVNGTTAGSGGAGSVHPVHTHTTDQGVQGLSSLLDGLVESLGGAVATLTENLVLSKEHTVDTTHEATTLTVEVGVDLLLEGGLVEVTGTDGNTHGDGLLLGLAGNVLEDGNGGVDTTALTEESADSTAGTLGGNEDDVNVSGDVDLGEVLENGGETVGEVEGLALGEEGLDSGPSLRLGGIGEEVHDDGTLLNGGVDIEQVLAGDPAVLDGLLPRSTILTDTDDDVQALVTQVKTLTVTLGTVTDESKGIVLEELVELLTGPIGTLVDILLDTGEVNGLDTTDGGDGSDDTGDHLGQSRPGKGGGHNGARGGHTGHAQGTGKTTRSHCELGGMEEWRVEKKKSLGEEGIEEGIVWRFKAQDGVGELSCLHFFNASHLT